MPLHGLYSLAILHTYCINVCIRKSGNVYAFHVGSGCSEAEVWKLSGGPRQVAVCEPHGK